MKRYEAIINSVLKAVALGTAVAVAVFGIMEVSTAEANTALLAIGLFALALLALRTPTEGT